MQCSSPERWSGDLREATLADVEGRAGWPAPVPLPAEWRRWGGGCCWRSRLFVVPPFPIGLEDCSPEQALG
eukprot:2659811-Alexandrium_andersonii.AAC.1